MEKKIRYNNRSGIPLGGLGAGKIEFCPNGKFTNCTASNNWDAPITGGGASSLGDTPDGPGITGAFLARFVEGAGAQVLRTYGCGPIPGLREEEIDFTALFPRAMVTYSPLGGVAFKLEAFSPLHLDEPVEARYRSSSLPVAIFRFTLRNEGEHPRRAAVAFSWENLVGRGGYAGVVVNHTDCRACSPIEEEDVLGVRFYVTKSQLNGRTVGEYTLLCPRRPGIEASYCAGWDLGTEGQEVWSEFAASGLLRQEAAKFNGAIGFQFARLDGGAVAQKVELAPGEEKTLEFVLSWYFPHLLSPGLPVVDYGHAYQNWFSSALQVGRTALATLDELLAGTKRWQEALLASNLPRWLVRKLCNDLAVLYSNSWYTKDYRFTMNESPTEMRGCLGTLDQRMASGGIFAMCFPGLAEAELLEWVRQQIKEDDPQRYAFHWNCRTGHPDLLLDREGAIRHDLGWDHLEGGEYGSPGWALLHWPDLVPAFIIQSYTLAAWTGNEDFLRRIYPSFKRALRFVARLDQNGDGVPELWGPGCCTYDNEHFPYYGASSYVSSLYLAALHLAERVARRFNDDEFAQECADSAIRVRRVLEEELWDPEKGYFISWRDNTAANWATGVRAHPDRSENCTVAQVAGEWVRKMLGLEPGVDKEKILSALRRIYELNVAPLRGCPANEASFDGTKRSFSWPFYIEIYFACNAAYFGLAEAALDTLQRIDYAVTECAGTPWDAPLVWEGPDNTLPGWGRWYMSNPASWFYLHALGGVSYNALEKTIRLAPYLPPGLGNGREIKDLPIFLPGVWLKLSVHDEDSSRLFRLEVTRKVGQGWPSFDTLWLGLPPGVSSPADLRVETEEGKPLAFFYDRGANEIRVIPDGYRLKDPGDALALRLSWR